MGKLDVTLEPSKGVVSEMAARIYSAYIIRGEVTKGEETEWMERSIREAVRIAKTVEASIETDDMPVGAENAAGSSDAAAASSLGESAPSDPAPPPKSEGSAAKSDLDAAIDDALYKMKDE
jgi:hypothetical protein